MGLRLREQSSIVSSVERAHAPESQVGDQLAKLRTQLANERTLLAYVRTAVGFIVIGVPAVWLIDHPHASIAGWVSIGAGMAILLGGIWRFVRVKDRIGKEQKEA
ncbi:YidH family protein [Nitrospira sp. KM1]|uniref:YidH family protein n=1 Tax=Nitrospira sp. KM1 TaxID=1936990 RepID=UPI0015646828|nr:DUF202 domain-containing protein [Nitrospira sp. KM1]